MRVLQISSTDLTGQRFNGQDMIQHLNREVPNSGYQLVWKKDGVDFNTAEMLKFPFSRLLQKIGDRLEKIFSIRALLHPSAFLLFREKYFRAADVVHYHLIYWPNYFSLLAMPLLTRLKPSVWTIHDLWPVTGHCVYPFECEKYLTGCGACPNLKINSEMKRDHTAFMWKVKRAIYKRSKLHLVVASKFMYDRVAKSPLFEGKKISLVPFGLDLKKFAPGDTRHAKRLLGIDEDTVTISFRATPGEFKGFDYVQKVLREIKTDKKICLISFNVKNMLEEFRIRHQIVDMGWVNDETAMLTAYHASDFFLMPSTQEAFGMMAMEAMACGKPAVVFDDTSLPEVVGGPDIGFVVRKGDLKTFAEVVNQLIENQDLREERGRKARAFAEKNYDFGVHAERLKRVYEQARAQFAPRAQKSFNIQAAGGKSNYEIAGK